MFSQILCIFFEVTARMEDFPALSNKPKPMER
jgi:hypothetical protein